MTIKEARDIEERFYRISNPSEEDIFLYTEAMDFLIHEESRPEDMMQLGGWYYDWRKFDLALKYYEMASAFDIDEADECLGRDIQRHRERSSDKGRNRRRCEVLPEAAGEMKNRLPL